MNDSQRDLEPVPVDEYDDSETDPGKLFGDYRHVRGDAQMVAAAIREGRITPDDLNKIIQESPLMKQRIPTTDWQSDAENQRRVYENFVEIVLKEDHVRKKCSLARILLAMNQQNIEASKSSAPAVPSVPVQVNISNNNSSPLEVLQERIKSSRDNA